MEEINEEIKKEIEKVFKNNTISDAIKAGIESKVKSIAEYGYLGDYINKVVEETVNKEIKPLIEQAILLEKEKLSVEIPKVLKSGFKKVIDDIEIRPKKWGFENLIRDSFDVALKSLKDND